MLAAQAIRAGDADVIVCGGMESMSNCPFIVKSTIRSGHKLGNLELIDSLVHDGLWDVYNNFHMGNTAELVAKKYDISRTTQDEYAVASHRKAVTAMKDGKFKDEIVSVEVKEKGASKLIDVDESPRADTALDKLALLKPVFEKDGTVTAANASPINDGASALVVVSEEKVKSLGVTPLARITGYASGGVEPKWIMMAPIEAVKNLLKKTAKKLESFDLFEINEAFAAASVAVVRELNIDPVKVNINGGAIALGHPIGASGARILTTLIYALKNAKKKNGIATMCLGGGNAVALSVELA
jgi:acetyl-CoA C-acetyltransferase